METNHATNNSAAVDLAGEHVHHELASLKREYERVFAAMENGEMDVAVDGGIVDRLNRSLATLERSIHVDQALAALPAPGGKIRVDNPEINDGEEFEAILLFATTREVAVEARYTGDLFVVDLDQVLRD